MRLGVIGYGTIARLALKTLARELPAPLELVSILVKPDAADRAGKMIEACGANLCTRFVIAFSPEEFLQTNPDCVAEAAGHGALEAYGAKILAAGKPLIVASAGALADGKLRAALDAAALQGKADWEVIPGAVGALDILRAAKLSVLEEVIYISRKPPAAWKGTQAQSLIDLDNTKTPTTFFEGHAGEAARAYPQNANVAATIALAGAGFEKTRVRMIADPSAQRNVHELQVRAHCAEFSIRIEGRPAPDNPKTSLTTAYSLADVLLTRLRE
ncbi:MAG: aspartate dehydrogenase [Alphaproteobacteria bacterium]|nr:aspartate dehydrogenase [Alphaproteobacteria bacterium]